jgi:hypothetical protein
MAKLEGTGYSERGGSVAQTLVFAASALLRTPAERRHDCRRGTQSARATTCYMSFVLLHFYVAHSV